MKKKISKSKREGAFWQKNVNESILFQLIESDNFFTKKHQATDQPACFFKTLVGGLEAYNYEEESFIKVKGKVLFGKKMSTNLYYFY